MTDYATDQNPDPKPSEGDVWLEVIEKYKEFGNPDIGDWDEIGASVIENMEKRRQFGIGRYGTPLQPNNGRDMLLDAYQEFLDFVCYYTAYMMECEKEDSIIEAFTFGMIYDLQNMIRERDGE